MANISQIVAASMTQSCGATANNTILIGLSGGADSIALTHILLSLGYSIEAAHCNFHLRGDESNRDEQFVVAQCKKWNIKLHIVHFETEKVARQENISIEMAARKLRYEWFANIMTTNNIDLLAVGHHADDSVETFFLNLTRGTGVRGLAGIKHRNGNIIRPMLNLSRADIEQYCTVNSLEYVNDSTNAEEHYLRNKIRHSVMPVFKSINPSFLETMLANMSRLNSVADMVTEAVNKFRSEAVGSEGDCTLISKRVLMERKTPELILFEILNEDGFTASTIADMYKCIEENRIGRQFFSNTKRAIIDRYNVVIMPRNLSRENEEFYIENGTNSIPTPIPLTINEYDKNNSFEIKKLKHVGMFDADLINFPLTIRRWQQGDSFKPLGMTGFKKLSDYFIDQKLRIDEKEHMWLLISGNDIIWIIGQRMDDRYKITNRTKKVLEITVAMSNGE